MEKDNYHKSNKYKNNYGFTLVELMVAMSVFIIVMFISMGAILSIFDANQKSKNLRSVMDNLNITLESMTRTIRFGSNYHCGTTPPTDQPLDCINGVASDTLYLKAVDTTQIKYSLVGGRVAKSVNGATNLYITSADAIVTMLSFRVYGSPAYNGGTDQFQPQVIIVISGYVDSKAMTKSSFNLETTVSQRLLDFQ